jgi:hypothetical protein
MTSLISRVFVTSALIVFVTIAPTYAQNCSGDAVGDIFFTYNPGVMTYVHNKGQRLIHFKAIGPSAEVPLDVPPGGQQAIAVAGQGFMFTACTANY